VTASVDGCVATWDIDTWKVTGTCNVGAAVSSLVVPSGGDLAHVAMQPHQSGIRVRTRSCVIDLFSSNIEY
jgi:hypothetical protein